MAELTSLNFVPQSWADARFAAQIQGGPSITPTAIVDISHESIVEVGESRGTGSRLRGVTTGRLKDSGKMVLEVQGADDFELALANIAPVEAGESKISLVFFDIFISHKPPGATRIRHIEMLGCRFLGRSEAYKDGTDVDKTDVTLHVGRIVKVVDGKRIVLL